MRHVFPRSVVAAVFLALLAVTASAAPAYPRRTLGFSVAAEGYGEGTGREPGEMLALGLVLEPFRFSFLVPSVSAIASIPVFPWGPERALLEARLDLRLFSLRSGALDRLVREPAIYAPAVSASYVLPVGEGGSFAALGLRPFAIRMGDGIYSILSPAIVADPREGMRVSGFSIELFEFTHFLL